MKASDGSELATSEHHIQVKVGGQRGQPFALSWVQRSAVQSAGCGDPCRTVISEFGRWGWCIRPGLHMRASLPNYKKGGNRCVVYLRWEVRRPKGSQILSCLSGLGQGSL